MEGAEMIERRARTRFTVDQYEEMGRAGIFRAHDRVELIDGEVIDMTPIGGRHAECVNLLARLLIVAARETSIVSIQNPIRLGEHSEPQPDFALIEPGRGYHTGSTPTSNQVLLVIEVSDTTLHYDRDVKIPLYARAGVPEVWLVDLQTSSMSVWQDPHDGEYRVVRMLRSGDDLTPALLPDVTLKVADLMG
jgi:Uma2 family endonuclease